MPELLLDTDIAPNSKALTDLDTEALSKYKEIKTRIFKVSKPDLSLRLEDYPKHLLRHLEDKELRVEDVQPLLCGEKTEDSLKRLLAKMDLEYELVAIASSKMCMWNLLVNTNLKISLIGRGETDEIAQQKAIEFLFDYMKQLILGI